MSKCVYCHERKGKRACPALNGMICSQCCGEHRLARIACPSDCSFLDANDAYQQKRAGERFAVERRDFYKALFELAGEPAAALFNLIEMMTYSFFHDRHDSADSEVLAGLESLRRSLSPLHIPAAPPPLFAQRLKAEFDAFVKHQAQGSASGQAPLDSHTTTEVLDRAAAFLTSVSGGALASRRFLASVIGYINLYHPDIAEHLTQHGDQGGRIVLPGDAASGAIISPEQFQAEARAHRRGHAHPR